MAGDVIDFVDYAFSAVSGWFLDVLGSTGLAPVYLVAAFWLLVFRFLIAPLVGNVYFSGLSDTAKEMRGAQKIGRKGGS